MARKITAYACEHGCGRKVLTSKQAMEKHEKKCFYNTYRKACVTCNHFESYIESNGMEHEPQYLHEFIIRICHADEDINLDEKLRFDCPLWELKQC